MRRPKTKEDKALDEALDVLIAISGHSPSAFRVETMAATLPQVR
jgi:hypothetical protein